MRLFKGDGWKKKRDSNRYSAGTHSFDFGSMSLSASHSPLYTLLALVGGLCLFLLCCVTFFSTSSYPVTVPQSADYDRSVMIEVEDTLSELMKLRSGDTRDIKKYATLFDQALQKYCVDFLQKIHFDREGKQSFMLNVGSTIAFVERGNKFTEHNLLLVTPSGQIAEPNADLRGAEPCPLLNGIFEMGAPDSNIDDAHLRTAPNGKKADGAHLFDHTAEIVEAKQLFSVAVEIFTDSAQCRRVARKMSKETMRVFIFDWHSMVHSDADNRKHKDAPRKKHKYAIGKDGKIYQANDGMLASNEYFWCSKLSAVLNEHWKFGNDDESFSYSSVHAEVERTFDEWFDSSPFDDAAKRK